MNIVSNHLIDFHLLNFICFGTFQLGKFLLAKTKEVVTGKIENIFDNILIFGNISLG